MSPLIVVRVVLCVCAFIFLIGYKRRKQLFTVKNADQESQKPMVGALIDSLIRENFLLLVVMGAIDAFALAFIIYTLYVPKTVG